MQLCIQVHVRAGRHIIIIIIIINANSVKYASANLVKKFFEQNFWWIKFHQAQLPLHITEWINYHQCSKGRHILVIINTGQKFSILSW